MTKKILTFSLAAMLLTSTSLAQSSWLYSSSARTLTCGTVTLNNVSGMSSNRLSIGGNGGNTTAIDVDLSLPVYDANGTEYVIDTLEQGA